MQDSKKEIKSIHLNQVVLDGEPFYKISNHDAMRPFFMSVVSDSDHWMFISSNGGISAGRKNSNYAIFPYYTDDKITELAHTTGSKTIMAVTYKGERILWEPFKEDILTAQKVERNVYKSVYGNSVLFEETNLELKLTFSYHWCNSDDFGFVRKCKLTNHGYEKLSIDFVDGIQNVMPYGVNPDLQVASSNLVDAYKRSQLDENSGLGIFALSAIIVDRAEPSEALKSNIVYSLGLENPTYLLSSLQLNDFRVGNGLTQESDIKAEKGAYFLNQQISLRNSETKEWLLVAEVNRDASDVVHVIDQLKDQEHLKSRITKNISKGTQNLISLVGASDGLQLTADKKQNSRHFSNTLFNIMRGGIFDDNYSASKEDFGNYLLNANKYVFEEYHDEINGLNELFTLQELKSLIATSDNPDFKRLAIEYLPLKFSRRHGDPSRPWNKFSINLRDQEGNKVLDYEGNWRDIFQNWEALAKSYPEYLEAMIFKFLNATTFDGYNPYRVTKGGFDWEIIEEHDPWSYIGYWGDHQIIYLQKFLESIEDHEPDKLISYFNEDLFVYANVPYKIKNYEEIVKDPKDTISFDYDDDNAIRNKRNELGADGALLFVKDEIYRVNFIEKILATSLAKVSNFIPEAGIWMNTQRPEWNDANNALVGNGVSMVTLYYLRRFFSHFQGVLNRYQTIKGVPVSEELHELFMKIRESLKDHSSILTNSFSDKQRRHLHDQLGKAASDFRIKVYEEGFSGEKQILKINQLNKFISLVIDFLDHSIKANKRVDNMYHAYNLITIKGANTEVTYLDEMLEGQVAVLSAGSLSPDESLAVLDAMKSSRLFREDQYSYVLYPNKELPKFLEKNIISKDAIKSSKLLTQFIENGDNSVVQKDVNGNCHFNGNFNNANSLNQTLDYLAESNATLIDTINEERDLVNQIFEEVFNHKAFTGRSGTFYGYEGLGSIYWHMVSKLLLAVQECCIRAIHKGASEEVVGRLLEHYYEINEGIGVHKTPELYGAFPTDPYSHTPAGKGAQQPGMTGQVKEDILSRIGELGVFVKQGQITYNPCLLRADEFLTEPNNFKYVTVNNEQEDLTIDSNSIVFTYCQVPMIYKISRDNTMKIIYSDGRIAKINSWTLDRNISKKIFQRTGEIAHIEIGILKSNLK